MSCHVTPITMCRSWLWVHREASSSLFPECIYRERERLLFYWLWIRPWNYIQNKTHFTRKKSEKYGMWGVKAHKMFMCVFAWVVTADLFRARLNWSGLGRGGRCVRGGGMEGVWVFMLYDSPPWDMLCMLCLGAAAWLALGGGGRGGEMETGTRLVHLGYCSLF